MGSQLSDISKSITPVCAVWTDKISESGSKRKNLHSAYLISMNVTGDNNLQYSLPKKLNP